MADPAGSGLAALALGASGGEGEPADVDDAAGPEAGDYRSAVEDMSGALVDAIQSGDKAGVADALQSLFETMSSQPPSMDDEF